MKFMQEYVFFPLAAAQTSLRHPGPRLPSGRQRATWGPAALAAQASSGRTSGLLAYCAFIINYSYKTICALGNKS